MGFLLETAMLAVLLFVGMLGFSVAGRRLRTLRPQASEKEGRTGAALVESAVFALLGLLLAFTFVGAAGRFEARRMLITDEANAIGTVYSRIDLLPASARPQMRELLASYTDARISVYADMSDLAVAQAASAKAATLQVEIWRFALVVLEDPNIRGHVPALFITALNEMIDITTTRAAAVENHPPTVIYLMLVMMSLIGALLEGYANTGSKSRQWFYTIVLALVMSTTLFVILDLEYPRRGLIRIDQADHLLTELRASMK